MKKNSHQWGAGGGEQHGKNVGVLDKLTVELSSHKELGGPTQTSFTEFTNPYRGFQKANSLILEMVTRVHDVSACFV